MTEAAPAVRSVLVTGGARSGKSLFAEGLIRASGREPVYVATCGAFDAEMEARIARHRDQRGPGWTTIEEQRAVAEVIAREAAPDRAVLVDCLTLWLSNCLFAEADIPAEVAALAESVRGAAGPVVLVTNEVGSGIVPENALARRFRDEQGRLNRMMAQACEAAVLVAAGLPLVLKPNASQPEIRL
ncbi:bifunctional adenosylcobinamide kinase/adenosylcobinamide-phosphate guanylyltransferase [Stappia sp.]|uniref:bifunctional adenosylcobinamide kinase/adenosylcobinamide-phosphate guanylyltransferase n=1 Tax=Stappia sp. TaxID=1870903 RepID=UPI0032D98C48